MSTNSLGGMDRKRAEQVYEAFPHHWLDNVDHDNLPEGLREPLTAALVEGRSYNIPFMLGNKLGITLIAVVVDELRQPLFTVHGAEFAVDEERTERLNKVVRSALLRSRRFTDEEFFDLLWEAHNFLRENGEASCEGDSRFIIGVTMAWCRMEQFSHSELRNWKRMIFGRFDEDVDYPLIKLIAINGEFDEEGSKALNNKLRTVAEF